MTEILVAPLKHEVKRNSKIRKWNVVFSILAASGAWPLFAFRIFMEYQFFVVPHCYIPHDETSSQPQ
jgi:hypothetical protein